MSAHDPYQVAALVAAILERLQVPYVIGGSVASSIHIASLAKIDFHVRPDTGIHAEEVRRARLMQIGKEPDEVARVATAEDVVVQKLLWYRMGDCVSDRQWRDIVGVLEQKGTTIDTMYLDRWSRELGLQVLLSRALSEAGLGDRDRS